MQPALEPQKSAVVDIGSNSVRLVIYEMTGAAALPYFNEKVLARASRMVGNGLWRGGDVSVIDGVVVNGSAAMVGRIAALLRNFQTGYLYHYAFVMVIGLCLVVGWLIW